MSRRAVAILAGACALALAGGALANHEFPAPGGIYASLRSLVIHDRPPSTPTAAEMSRNDLEVEAPVAGLTGTVLLALRGQYKGTPEFPQRIIEVDRRGRIVRKLDVPSENHVGDLHKLANGNYLFTVAAVSNRSAVPLPGNVVETDVAGNTIRNLDVHVTHSADYLGNGNLLISNGYDDKVTEFDPAGKVVWSWDAHDHIREFDATTYAGFDAAPYVFNLFNRKPTEGEWLHLNAAQRLPNGNTVIGLRNLDLVIEVNPAGNVVWSFGPLVLKHEHCPSVLPNDHLLVTDNGNARVIEVDRRTQKIVWAYQTDLLFPAQGCALRLPNGDTLITDSFHNRVVEVTPEGRVAWRLTVKTPGAIPLYRVAWSPS